MISLIKVAPHNGYYKRLRYPTQGAGNRACGAVRFIIWLYLASSQRSNGRKGFEKWKAI